MSWKRLWMNWRHLHFKAQSWVLKSPKRKSKKIPVEMNRLFNRLMFKNLLLVRKSLSKERINQRICKTRCHRLTHSKHSSEKRIYTQNAKKLLLQRACSSFTKFGNISLFSQKLVSLYIRGMVMKWFWHRSSQLWALLYRRFRASSGTRKYTRKRIQINSSSWMQKGLMSPSCAKAV